MNLSKIITTIKSYLADDKLDEKKQDKIKEIVEKLALKKTELKQNLKESSDTKSKEEILHEYKTISTLLKKSKKLIDSCQ